ncbi:Unconventional myosin-VI [Nymphon striatum]|nr:Unconventional myosin-VI [Nymphon striatum]KAG1714831.1 Unconventional myosin-VI [Nymphon striatum]KAG1714832.1 Unconventional myosin-VI [Nymphon striatum]
MLDEESKLPRPSYMNFTTSVHNKHKGHFRLALPRKSKLKYHRELRDDEGFLIRHFAGAVCYQTALFIDKNNDALHASLKALVQESKNSFLKSLFIEGNTMSASSRGKLSFVSVGTKFRRQLTDLMNKLDSTGTNFIRCIKPNLKMVDHMFEGGQILSQLQCSGMTSVLELMQQGYPSRTLFIELYNMYKKYLPPELARLDARLFCKALFKALGLNETDFKFGLTKVFFRPGKFAEFDQIMKSDPENLANLIKKVRKWLIASRWKKAQWCALSVIKLKNKIIYRLNHAKLIQSYIRMYLAVKKYRPRYKAIMKIKMLQTQLKHLASIASQIKNDNANSSSQVQALQNSMHSLINRIKTTEMQEKDIHKAHMDLIQNVDNQLKLFETKLMQQKDAEEQERLRKIQDEMEREKRRREEEERKKREEEEARKKRAEIEAKRKLEEEMMKKKDEEDRIMAEKLQVQLRLEEEENLERDQQLQQERRDHELALRLAQDTNGQVEDVSTPLLSRSTAILNEREKAAGKKYDLSKWKYSQLRDAINTSCDLELLEACREEFHRRLKVYHAWKSKNQKRGQSQVDRAPQTVIQNGNSTICYCRLFWKLVKGLLNYADETFQIVVDVELFFVASAAPAIPPRAQSLQSIDKHRYFRIPFVRPSDQQQIAANNLKGWWFAHFDGQWIARQMELHPNKPPILLISGHDDMQMCELSLEETGLTRKRGAEILASEFEVEWLKHNGSAYVSPNEREIR